MINTVLDAAFIYKHALAVTFTKEANAQDFKVFFLSFLDILAQEALPYENSIREAEGDPLLVAAPVFTDFSDIIPFDDNIVRIAFPYGVASWFFQDDMDDWRYREMRGRFITALQEAGKVNFGDVNG